MNSKRNFKTTIFYFIIWALPLGIFILFSTLLYLSLHSTAKIVVQKDIKKINSIAAPVQASWNRVSHLNHSAELNSFIQQINQQWIIQSHSFILSQPEESKVILLLYKEHIHLPLFTNKKPLCTLQSLNGFSLSYKIQNNNLEQSSFIAHSQASLALQVASYKNSEIKKAYQKLLELTQQGFCAYLTYSQAPLIKGKAKKPSDYIFLRVGFFSSQVDAFVTKQQLTKAYPDFSQNHPILILKTSSSEKDLELVNFQNERSLPYYAISVKVKNLTNFLPYLAAIKNQSLFASIIQSRNADKTHLFPGYFYRLYIGQFANHTAAKKEIDKLNQTLQYKSTVAFFVKHKNHSIISDIALKEKKLLQQQNEQEKIRQADQEKQLLLQQKEQEEIQQANTDQLTDPSKKQVEAN